MKEKGPRKVNIPTLKIPKDATPEEIKKMTKEFLKDLKLGKIPGVYTNSQERE